MNKIILVIFVTVFHFSSCSSPKKKEDETVKIVTPKPQELPNILLTVTGGTKLFAKELIGKKVILIFFQPDCDHCQAEGKEIKENIVAFKAYDVYFISASNIDEIKKFAEDLTLNEEKNFHFASTDVQSIIDNYGSILAPSIYIYSQEGTLLTKFNGQTKIDIILKSL